MKMLMSNKVLNYFRVWLYLNIKYFIEGVLKPDILPYSPWSIYYTFYTPFDSSQNVFFKLKKI